MAGLAAAARQRATAVSLRQLFEFGGSPQPEQRLRNARFLLRELPIRLAQRVQELKSLPYGLGQTEQVGNVIGWYKSYFDQLSRVSPPGSRAEEQQFTQLLEEILQDHNAVIQTMALGVIEMRQRLPGGYSPDMRTEVDKWLDRFFMARIGLRFLISHHIAADAKRAGFAGIIQEACSPLAVCERAAADARYVCEKQLDVAPEIEFEGVGETVRFCYVPMHLHYIMTELLKNSLRATVERHRGLEEPPPVQVVIAQGRHDITIKVSDRGGGIPFTQMDNVWSYVHSTATNPSSAWARPAPQTKPKWRTPSTEMVSSGLETPLAGFGCGLPLSRLYARYFGGGLQLMSMEGFGTDSYLHLNRWLPLGCRLGALPE